MERKAKLYFEKNPLLFADMKECVDKGRAELLHAGEEGVLLVDRPSKIAMLACENEAAGKSMLQALSLPAGNRKFVVAHGNATRAAVCASFTVDGETPCDQVVFSAPVAFETDLTFKKADETEIERIIAEYDRESPENLRFLQKEGKIWCAYDPSGAFVGFIGRHPEGSMGLLLIFPEFRRKGYAFALEGHQINEILKEGRVPYAHIIEGNDKSLFLQKKLGARLADEKVTWMRLA